MINSLKQHPTIMNALKQYEMMPSRDRAALKILGVVLVLVLLYFVLWQPAYSYKKEAETFLQQQKDLLALVVENKTDLASLNSNSRSGSVSLNSQQLVSSVTNLAKQTGVVLKRFEPSGEKEIKIWVEDVPFDKVMTWLTTMKRTLNIKVDQISVDRSEASGLISARLTLSSS